MIKYNAVIIMENLNYGFKNSRVHVEQQAYQNFEIALLQKLNYLSFKNVPAMQEGGISNAYQLTAKYKSFDMIGTQSGFVFYVPSNYTSKIDPATGFVNLFSSKHVKYENITKSQEFFDKFTSISYNDSLGYIFTFKYSNFSIEDAVDTEWQVCTGKSLRCVYTLNRNSGRGNYENINVTSLINELFSKYNISNNNLKRNIIQQTSKQFFEKLLWLFKVTVSLRYTNSKEDYILSPILKNGEFFDSRIAKNNYPCDGDANGAYHIALKGLKLITEQIDLDGNVTVDKKGETNKNWFTYAKKIANGKE